MRKLLGHVVCVWLAATVSLSTAPSLRITYRDTKLANGLRVILSEDHSAPLFAIAVGYNVGSRDERKGRAGFAHLFEHMMFKGSANVADGEHSYLMVMYGGSMNATTSKDRTVYYEILPSNQLDLALFLEADRMRSLEITQASLDNQRSAVQEERRLALDNQPYGRTAEALEALAYDNFAYEHPVIGTMTDLEAATAEDVAVFFKAYYAPNNAVVAIVGAIDSGAALGKVRKYFESIPPRPAPPPVDMTEPEQSEERRAVIHDPLARLAQLDIAYKVPPSASPDRVALDVLGTILSNGRSSRLHEAIVRLEQLAPGISSSAPETRGPGLFRISAQALPGKSLADLEAAIDRQIERVQSAPVADWELQKARRVSRRGFVAAMGSALQRAIALSQSALLYNDPERLNTRPARVAAVTADDVQRVARTYLVRRNRAVVHTLPKGQGSTEGAR